MNRIDAHLPFGRGPVSPGGSRRKCAGRRDSSLVTFEARQARGGRSPTSRAAAISTSGTTRAVRSCNGRPTNGEIEIARKPPGSRGGCGDCHTGRCMAPLMLAGIVAEQPDMVAFLSARGRGPMRVPPSNGYTAHCKCGPGPTGDPETLTHLLDAGIDYIASDRMLPGNRLIRPCRWTLSGSTTPGSSTPTPAAGSSA